MVNHYRRGGVDSASNPVRGDLDRVAQLSYLKVLIGLSISKNVILNVYNYMKYNIKSGFNVKYTVY
jgi:hypothetical protein